MLMGLCFPKLDAVNETVIIKQSMATGNDRFHGVTGGSSGIILSGQ